MLILLYVVTQHRVIGSSDIFQDYMLACQQVKFINPVRHDSVLKCYICI